MTVTTREPVTAVIDGDTFRTSESGTSIRLEGVDTPETYEPGYEGAKNALTSLILHREVEIDTKARDIYSRRVAQVWRLPDYVNVNAQMKPYSK